MTFFVADQERLLRHLHRDHPSHAEYLEFLKDTLGAFAASEVAPHAHDNDRDEVFREDTFRALGQLGFMALAYPPDLDGFGAPFPYYVAGLETLAKADAGFALAVAIHGTTCEGIRRFASAALRDRYLADLIHGRKIGCFCLSEAGAGSDAKAMRTTYVYDPGAHCYLLTGAKYWITNALSADVFFVLAADKAAPGKVSAFLVTRGAEGRFEQHKIEEKMGVRGSNTAELLFEDYRVPADHLIGDAGAGFGYAMAMLSGGRITIGAWSTGIAQGAYEKLMKYAHERQLFGRFLADLDNTRKELAEMAIEIAAGRALTYGAAFDYATGADIRAVAPIAKVKATEAAFYVAERAIQLAGGYGFVGEARIERHLRDAVLGRIGEGANELLKVMVIPRLLIHEFQQSGARDPW
ncbi:MAG: acyl-CoA dehydrogenase family protein [Candidatus Schekmanbacteria bacterium]|nr:acyl-CoA dehydrogenase family protein [Candidatus Schekmanbacteria bacterium]